MSNFQPYDNFGYENFSNVSEGKTENPEEKLTKLCKELGWTCTPSKNIDSEEEIDSEDEKLESESESESDSEEPPTGENFANSYTDSKGHCVGARPGTYTRHTNISDLAACQAKCNSESDCILIGHGPWNNDGSKQCITYSKCNWFDGSKWSNSQAIKEQWGGKFYKAKALPAEPGAACSGDDAETGLKCRGGVLCKPGYEVNAAKCNDGTSKWVGLVNNCKEGYKHSHATDWKCRKPVGGACTAGTDCDSGNCVGGFCCKKGKNVANAAR